MITSRTFKKTSRYAGVNTSIPSAISHWTWTRSVGLRVTYTDGLSCKSDYTLAELLSTGRPEGSIVETTWNN